MDGTVQNLTGRLWMCKRKDGHVLGLVVAVGVAEGLVEQLYLFQAAVLDVAQLDQAKIKGRVEGTMYDIECEHCRALRTWHEGKGAMKRAVASYLAE